MQDLTIDEINKILRVALICSWIFIFAIIVCIFIR